MKIKTNQFLAGILIGLVIGLILYFTHPITKIKYTNRLYLTCMVYNESGNYSMACNPIDVENYGNKTITWGFKLPVDPRSYNISRIIHCTYDLNLKRFIECHQYAWGVKPLNETGE